MKDYLTVVKRHLDKDLISPQALSRLQSITQTLPPYPIGGLECRLKAEDSRVDFFAYVPRHVIHLQESVQNNPVWQSLQKFSQEWTQSTSTLYQKVKVVGLEFDLDIDPSQVVIPCIFFALNREFLWEDNSWKTLLDSWPLNILKNSDNCQEIFDNFQSCSVNLPEKAWIAHLGMMLSRSTEMVRVVVKDIAPQQIPDYLTKIGWAEPTNELKNLVTNLSLFVDYIALDIDVGQGIYPTIGLECRIEKQQPQDSRWRKFLEYLVNQGLCTPEKKESLLSWIGITQKSDCPHLWPDSLMMGDLFAGDKALSVFYRRIYHIKIVYQPGLPLSAKAYLEFGHRWLDRRLLIRQKPAEDNFQYRQQVRDYYEYMTPKILKDIGTTYQAGLLKKDTDDNPFEATNLYCASHAGIQPGYHILDAGCGVCGPSIDIAHHIQGVKIDAITLSPTQVKKAQELIEKNGLTEQIKVHLGDFHQLPFPDEIFDVVMFLESDGYSYDPQLLYQEVYRVLRPGGQVYIKGIFIKASPLSNLEKQELAAFNQVYVYRTIDMSEVTKVLDEGGFQDIISQDLSHIISGEKAIKAMFKEENGQPTLTEFGKLHYRDFQCLPPLIFGEVKARKPEQLGSVARTS